MLIIDEILSESKAPYNRLEEFYNPNELLMFDIETTGLSPSNAILYLIGINYKDRDGWHITQYFNDDGQSEEEMLRVFMEKLSGYRYLLHFNGDTFDIPFVRKRIQHANLSARISKDGRLSIPDFFDDLQSVDLYKMIKPFKNALGLENLKQKTIEEYLGLHRIDTYNGGELIQVYHSFLSQPTQRLQSLLLQHNRDDMEGMYVLSSILSLRALADGKLKFRDISCEETSQGMLRLRFGFLLDHSLPIRITASLGHIHLNAYQNAGYLLVPILSDELKHFFPDYKNYYYYPELDTAYHQSVDLRSETLLRERAKKANCYIRCYGHFIPQLSLSVCDGFRRTATDKESYLEVNDSFLGDRERLALYTGKMCGLLLRAK